LESVLKLLKEKPIELFLLIFCTYLLATTYYADWVRHSDDLIDPVTLPRLVLFLIVFILIVLLIIKAQDRDEEYRVNIKEAILLVSFTAVSVLLIHVIHLLGIFVSVLLFLIIWMYFFGYRKPVMLAVLSLGGATAVYYLVDFSGIYIPRTILLF